MLHWIARPHQTEPLLREWSARYPAFTCLDTVRLLNQNTYAITVTDRALPADRKRKCLVTVPHAHEPAGTAACMNILNELLDGRQLDGSPTSLDRDTLLRETLISFIPDGNPDGRSRSPEDAWDGGAHTNDEFLMIAFGRDAATGQRFPRVDRWQTTDHLVDPIGIIYEQIDETTYVEPNRDWGSSFFRLVHRLTGRHEYDQFLDLHQTEFGGGPINCEILLPVTWDELPESIRSVSGPWAEEITAAWRGMEGASPRAPAPLGYTGQQRAYFEQRWGDLYRSIPCLSVEIQNNSPHTPPDLQRRLAEAAIRTSLKRLFAADNPNTSP
jgi:hypothetical protein